MTHKQPSQPVCGRETDSNINATKDLASHCKMSERNKEISPLSKIAVLHKLCKENERTEKPWEVFPISRS